MKKQVPDIVKRYEEAINNGSGIYFDTDEIEAISNYYDDNDEPDKAMSAVEYGLFLHQSDPTLLSIKVSYLLDIDNIEDAEKILNSLSVDNIDVRILRIELNLMMNDLLSADVELQYILQHFKIEEEDAIDIIDMYSNLVGIESVLDKINEIIELINNPDKFLLECINYTDRELLYDSSIKIYNKLLDSNPFNTDYWLCLTARYIMNSEYSKAIESCEYVFAIDDNNYKAHLYCGKAYYLLGKYENAIEYFTQSYLLDNTQRESAIMLSNSFWKIGEYNLSLQFVDSLEHDSVKLLSIKVKYFIATNQLDMALELLGECLNANKDKLVITQDIYLLLFDVLYLKGETVAADTVLQKYKENLTQKNICEFDEGLTFLCITDEYLIRKFCIELYFGRISESKSTLNELYESLSNCIDNYKLEYDEVICTILKCESFGTNAINYVEKDNYDMTAFYNYIKDTSYVPFKNVL